MATDKKLPEQPPSRGWFLVPLWLAVAALIWFLASVSHDVNGWLRNQLHLAGWMQGAGVIITVVVAFITIERQSRASASLEEHKRLFDVLQKTEIVYQLLGNALEAIDDGHAALLSPTERDITPRLRTLERAAQALEALPVLEIPGPGVAIAVIKLPSDIRVLVGSLEQAMAGVSGDKEARTIHASSSPIAVPQHLWIPYSIAHLTSRDGCTQAMDVCKAQSDEIRRRFAAKP